SAATGISARLCGSDTLGVGSVSLPLDGPSPRGLRMRAMPPTESADVVVEDGGARILLSGRLDARGVAAVWRKAVKSAKEGSVVDATGVTYCDSAGAALIYELRERAGAKVEGLPDEGVNL